jgi:hypothetical protein
MQTYLAFFDILGFKEFISNADSEIRSRLMNNLIRDSQSALSLGKTVPRPGGGLMPDLSSTNIQCLHVSDSIVFWTDNVSTETFLELVKCSAYFLRQCMQITFPVRGCIVAGEIDYKPFTLRNKKGVEFQNSSLYGKALTDAYLKAEAQDWVGCYVDRSAVSTVDDKIINDLIYANELVYYPIPLKDGSANYEFVIRTVNKTINDVFLKNPAKGAEEMFHRHMNDQQLSESVRRKLTNTIKFYDYFRENMRALERSERPST